MEALSRIGVAGLAVVGQSLALNIAEKGFPISVYNWTPAKVDETVGRAVSEGGLPVLGKHSPADFVLSIKRPRTVIILVEEAGLPVDETISSLSQFMEPGDAIVEGGDEWYENTEIRIRNANARNLLYLGMGISGGEVGARRGPSLMPGGSFQAYQNIEGILTGISAQVNDGPCVTYVGKGGSGNFVKMVHDGIELGDMQLISEAYNILRSIGGLSNRELAGIFAEWNGGELESFLMEVAAGIFSVKDEHEEGDLVNKILDETKTMRTGYLLVEQSAELSFASPIFTASLDCRNFAGVLKEAETGNAGEVSAHIGRFINKKRLIEDMKHALYSSKICNYAQGMNFLKRRSEEKMWDLNLGELARIWKGGCIIRARFLDRIKAAYERNRCLKNLLLDSEFVMDMVQRHGALRRIVRLGLMAGICPPAMAASLRYFDASCAEERFDIIN